MIFRSIQKARHVQNNENTNVTNFVNAATERIRIFLESKEKNYRKNQGLDNRHVQKIRRIYTPCQNDDEKKHIFKILYTVSLNDKIKNIVWQIFDEIIKMEE